jgi:hypothetical protein
MNEHQDLLKKLKALSTKILYIFNEVDEEPPAQAEMQICFEHLFFQIYLMS